MSADEAAGEERLDEARRRFVTPFYLKLGATVRSTEDRAVFLDACDQLDESTARLLLDTREWRGRMTVSWMIGVRRWVSFTDQIVAQLVASELVYAGQGYCVALALLGTDAAADGLVSYLDRWLPEREAFYDQPWAIAALTEIDRRTGSRRSNRFLATGGLWDTWVAAQTQSADLTSVAEIVASLTGGDDQR